MILATVSSKGQITLPAKARRELGIRQHGRVSVEIRKGEMVIKPVPLLLDLKGFAGKALSPDQERKALVGSVRDLKGALPKPKRTLSLADMDTAIGRGAAR